MSMRATFVLMILFLLLGSFALFDPFQLKQKKEESKERDQLVFLFKDKLLESLRVKSGELEVHFSCKSKEACPFNGAADWNITKPVADSADPSSIGSVTSTLVSLNSVQKINVEKNTDLTEFGLANPVAEIELRVKGESESYLLKLGSENPIEKNVYAISNKDPQHVYLVPEYFLAMLKKDLFHWRNKRIFPSLDSEMVESLDWKSDQAGLRRIVKKENQWQFDAPVKVPANFVMSEGLVSTLVFASAKAVYAEKAEFGKPKFEFQIGLKSGNQEKLKIYEVGKAAARITIARLNDSSQMYVVDSAAFQRFSKPLIEYRERRFITQEEKEKIAEAKLSFPQEKKAIVLKLSGDEWVQQAGDKPEGKISQARVKNFIDALAISEADSFEQGPLALLYRRVLGDFEIELRDNAGAVLKKIRYAISDRKRALSEGQIPNEVRVSSGDFLKLLPVRFSDLLESNNKQVVVPGDQNGSDGHDHSDQHAH